MFNISIFFSTHRFTVFALSILTLEK